MLSECCQWHENSLRTQASSGDSTPLRRGMKDGPPTSDNSSAWVLDRSDYTPASLLRKVDAQTCGRLNILQLRNALCTKCSSIVSSRCASRASDMHASPWHAAQHAVVGFVQMEAPQNAQVPDKFSWGRTGGCTVALTSARTPYYCGGRHQACVQLMFCADCQDSGSAVLQLYGHLSSDTVVKWLAGTAIGHGLGQTAWLCGSASQSLRQNSV